MFCMLPLRLFAAYFLVTLDLPADVTYSLSLILTSAYSLLAHVRFILIILTKKTQPHPTFLQFYEISHQKSHRFHI